MKHIQKLLRRLEQTLTVPAAERTPAIVDALLLVDRLKVLTAADEAATAVRLAVAREVWEGRANGACQGTSPDKGGRAWIDGEFQLDELEALCTVLRAEAGEAAQGLDDLIEERAEDAALSTCQKCAAGLAPVDKKPCKEKSQ